MVVFVIVVVEVLETRRRATEGFGKALNFPAPRLCSSYQHAFSATIAAPFTDISTPWVHT
jgi:hypothetical protein